MDDSLTRLVEIPIETPYEAYDKNAFPLALDGAALRVLGANIYAQEKVAAPTATDLFCVVFSKRYANGASIKNVEKTDRSRIPAMAPTSCICKAVKNLVFFVHTTCNCCNVLP